MAVSGKTRSAIIWGGILLLLIYGALLYISADAGWNALPNYKRLARFIPLTIGYAMVHVDGLADWKGASTRDKWGAVGAVAVNLITIGGSLAWWVLAPEAAD